MAIKSFRKPASLHPETAVLSSNIDDFSRQLVKNPILDFVLLKQVDLSTAPVNVSHTLGRPWVGWFLTRKSDDVSTWEAATQDNTSLFLTLVSAADVTVDIYIF